MRAWLIALALIVLGLAGCTHVDNSLPAPPHADNSLPADQPVVDNSLPRPQPGSGFVCSSHILFWLPMLEQSVCGTTTLEMVYSGICIGAGGQWDFTPGQMPRCIGPLVHASPRAAG